MRKSALALVLVLFCFSLALGEELSGVILKGLSGTLITDDDSKQIKEIRRRFHQPGGKEKGNKKEVQFPPLPQAVSSFGAAVADGWVYVYGGHATKTHVYSTEVVLGKFYRLKLSEPKKWEELPSGLPVQGLALVAHGGKIYRLGGMQPRNQPGAKVDNHSVASCACFDPASNKWQALPDLPAARSSHDAVVVGDKIVVVGGWKLNGVGKELDFHDTALMLDLKKPLKWQALPQPFQRRALTAAVLDGMVYVIGGMDANDKIQLIVNILDVATGKWSMGPNIPGPRRNGFSPAAIDAGGRLYLSTADGKVWRLSAKADPWDEIGSLQQPRIVHRLLPASENFLLALGGAFGGDNIARSEVVPILAAHDLD